jgi:hypothetical protein
MRACCQPLSPSRLCYSSSASRFTAGASEFFFSRNVRHDQPVRHARLEMLENAGLSSRRELNAADLGLGSEAAGAGLGSEAARAGLGSEAARAGLGSETVGTGLGSETVGAGLGSETSAQS